VPHWQKLHVILTVSLGSPQGIAAPVHAHELAPVVQVMPSGHNAGSPKGPVQPRVPLPQAGPMPQ